MLEVRNTLQLLKTLTVGLKTLHNTCFRMWPKAPPKSCTVKKWHDFPGAMRRPCNSKLFNGKTCVCLLRVIEKWRHDAGQPAPSRKASDGTTSTRESQQFDPKANHPTHGATGICYVASRGAACPHSRRTPCQERLPHSQKAIPSTGSCENRCDLQRATRRS